MWEKELAKAVVSKLEDAIKDRYIQIRKDRLGGMMPFELINDFANDRVKANVITSINNLKFLLSDEQYDTVIAEILRRVENIMDEVEGIE